MRIQSVKSLAAVALACVEGEGRDGEHESLNFGRAGGPWVEERPKRGTERQRRPACVRMTGGPPAAEEKDEVPDPVGIRSAGLTACDWVSTVDALVKRETVGILPVESPLVRVNRTCRSSAAQPSGSRPRLFIMRLRLGTRWIPTDGYAWSYRTGPGQSVTGPTATRVGRPYFGSSYHAITWAD